MRTYFVSHHTVKHPETRETVIHQGEAVRIEDIEAIADECGIDHLPGELIFVDKGEKLSTVLARIKRTTDLM